MKAWHLQSDDDYEGHSMIVFADDRNDAKRQGAGRDELGNPEYLSVRATRCPKFDGRENNPPTLRELVMDHGWYTVCCRCEARLTSDDGITWDGDGAYCHGCPTFARTITA